MNSANNRMGLFKDLTSWVVLAVIVVVVHAFYEFYIVPGATAALQSGGSEASRHFVVIMKDTEQKVCLMAMFWCAYLIVIKALALMRNRNNFETGDEFWQGFKQDGQINWQAVLNELESSAAKGMPTLETWANCIRRFESTKSVQNASDALQASIEALAVRLEADNSLIRYLIWAIPSIGFVGTVRGIGQALAKADEALAGNIAGMTDSLGVAFNSTLVALFISLFLMALLHKLQRLQDGLVVETQEHCEKHLLKYLH